jgi:hypothetical protein
MRRAYYTDTIQNFLKMTPQEILGALVEHSEFSVETTQKEAWIEQIRILSSILQKFPGSIYLEYAIPRMGRRIDAVLLIESVIFVIEFKVGEKDFTASAEDQVWDYGLDLKNFHETSHAHMIAPILVATKAEVAGDFAIKLHHDKLVMPIKTNETRLGEVIQAVIDQCKGARIDPQWWDQGRYSPTPTIIEAALVLYRRHSVQDISRSDASATNLSKTSETLSRIIHDARDKRKKVICFVTGVPGAGKTLVGLNVATTHNDDHSDLYSVYLSGNGPLVKILCEALARDKVSREKERGNKIKLGVARSEVKTFIQNVHHFRDECLVDAGPLHEHVVLFDEAQRAWNKEQTVNFMRRKKNKPNFDQSEPEFLISCLDRHPDWAVIVCLVGGGQEIHTGEAGISEWVDALNRSYPDWHVCVSDRLTDSEYAAGQALKALNDRPHVKYLPEMHLSVSMRSFRAENVSVLVKELLDRNAAAARRILGKIGDRYPIVLTRDQNRARNWLRKQARGTERYGIVVSSKAQRLKPYAIDVKSPMDPIHWFLDSKEDVRSSYYLEDVATEFHVQGLELDWVCVTWDGDFRYMQDQWDHREFYGDRWRYIRSEDKKQYQINAYRVLLTRARQGMVICVPEGDPFDPTRDASFYDGTYEYLRKIGFSEL